MNKQERQQLLRKLWGKKSPREIASKLEVSLRTLQKDVKELGLLPYVAPSVDDRVRRVREQELERSNKRAEREMARRIVRLEREQEVILRCRDYRTHYSIPNASTTENYAVAVAVASDWHIEEVVHKWQVNGLNSYNEEVVKERVERYFRHTVKLLKKEQTHATIDTLVLALLGDFISGSIHDELMESNRLLPADAIMEVQAYLAGGIQYILDNTDVNLVIPCSMGNHSRMTKKVHISTEAGNSLERIMYFALANQFKGNARVKFVVGSGYHTYVYLFDDTFTVRFHHGHSIKFGGGVGGITIPINKAIAQWNKARNADLDVFGHFHQFLDGGNWVVNGSLIGYNAYALSIKASPEPPRQAFFLIDRDSGKTIVAPIVLNMDK